MSLKKGSNYLARIEITISSRAINIIFYLVSVTLNKRNKSAFKHFACTLAFEYPPLKWLKGHYYFINRYLVNLYRRWRNVKSMFKVALEPFRLISMQQPSLAWWHRWGEKNDISYLCPLLTDCVLGKNC